LGFPRIANPISRIIGRSELGNRGRFSLCNRGGTGSLATSTTGRTSSAEDPAIDSRRSLVRPVAAGDLVRPGYAGAVAARPGYPESGHAAGQTARQVNADFVCKFTRGKVGRIKYAAIESGVTDFESMLRIYAQCAKSLKGHSKVKAVGSGFGRRVDLLCVAAEMFSMRPRSNTRELQHRPEVQQHSTHRLLH
jgi:hypothetical protein